MDDDAYHADPSLRGKLRRKLVRLQHRRPSTTRPERAMVSFTFDDAPVSAFSTGAEVLERRGIKATYFVCAGTAGQSGAVGRLGDREDILRVEAAGHEIACHTFSHLDLGRADGRATIADLDRNAATLEVWGVAAPRTFAYPYGEVGAPAKAPLADRFQLARAIHPGLVQAGTDLAQAPAVGIEGEAGEAKAQHWIDQAVRQRAWLILFTHGVEDALAPYGCTRAALERLADRVLRAGLDVVTVAEGARRARGAA